MTIKDIKAVIDGPVMIRAGRIQESLESLHCRAAKKYWSCEVLQIVSANFKICVLVDPA